jgi:hypothetical protein
MGHPERKDPGTDRPPEPDTNPDHKPLEAPGDDRRDPADKREIEEPPPRDKPAPVKSMEQEAADHEVDLRNAKKGGEEVIETASPLSAIRTPPD